MHRRSLGGIVLVASLLCACPGKPSGGDAGVPDAAGPTCPHTFAFRPATSASQVTVEGEWDGFDRLAHKLVDDGNGNWSLVLQVPAGRWGYLFLVDGAEFLDPANASQVAVKGKTYSQLADCQEPSLTPDPGSVKTDRPAAGQGSFTETLAIVPGAGTEAVHVEGTLRTPDDLPGPGGSARALTSGEITVDGTVATLHLTGLPDGKYTARLHAVQGGSSSPDVLLPFWIEAKPFDWQGTPLYMLMTDRFRNGEPANDPAKTANVPAPADFLGGDLQGVEAALREGWFDKLGVKAIWVTPWQTQPAGSWVDDTGTHQVMGYHGYWPVKAREVDPRFGGDAALSSMVREAHKHGVRIVMDTVLNHVHQDHEYYQDPAKKGWFRTTCVCGSSADCGWDNARLYCQFTPYMPDVNWTLPEVRQQFTSDVVYWLETFDVDGLREDAVKHIEPEGIQAVAVAVRARFEQAGTKYLMFGETLADPWTINQYISPVMLDSQMDAPLFQAVPGPVFATDSMGLQTVKSETDNAMNNFGDKPMVRFIDSQDQPRFITKADPANAGKQGNKWDYLPSQTTDQRAYDRLYSALLNLMTLPGVPLIYYGDEYGEFGASDPDNRHMLLPEASLNSQQQAQLARTRKLLSTRSSLRGLGKGKLVQMWCNNNAWGTSGGDLMAYARLDATDPKQSAIVVLNLEYDPWDATTHWGQVVVNFPAEASWTSGTVVDALTDREYAFSNSSVTVDVPARGGVILRLK